MSWLNTVYGIEIPKLVLYIVSIDGIATVSLKDVMKQHRTNIPCAKGLKGEIYLSIQGDKEDIDVVEH